MSSRKVDVPAGPVTHTDSHQDGGEYIPQNIPYPPTLHPWLMSSDATLPKLTKGVPDTLIKDVASSTACERHRQTRSWRESRATTGHECGGYN